MGTASYIYLVFTYLPIYLSIAVVPNVHQGSSNVGATNENSSSSGSNNSSDTSSSSASSSSSNSESEEDVDVDFHSDDSVKDKDYVPSSEEENIFVFRRREERLDLSNNPMIVSPQKGRKRKQCPDQWKRNQKKKLRNTGKAYQMTTKTQKMRPEKKSETSMWIKMPIQVFRKDM